MPGFLLTANVYTLDIKDFDKVKEAFMVSEMQKGVRAFLKACLARIPVRTGFLRGAFRQIINEFKVGGSGADLNETLATLFSAAAEGSEKSGTLFREREAHHDRKLSAAGKQARENALKKQIAAHAKASRVRENKKLQAQGKSKNRSRIAGEYYYDGKRKILKTPTSGIPYATKPSEVLSFSDNSAKFFLDVSISYYRINDFYSRIKGAPWGSMDAGAAAMISSLEKSVNRFPKISEIMTQFKIALRGRDLKTETKRPNVDALIASRLLSITPGD